MSTVRLVVQIASRQMYDMLLPVAAMALVSVVLYTFRSGIELFGGVAGAGLTFLMLWRAGLGPVTTAVAVLFAGVLVAIFGIRIMRVST